MNIDKTIMASTKPGGKGTQITEEELREYFPVELRIRSFKTKEGATYTIPMIICRKMGMYIPVSKQNNKGNWVNGIAIEGNEIELELPLQYFNAGVAGTEAYLSVISPEDKLKILEQTSRAYAGLQDLTAITTKSLSSFKEGMKSVYAQHQIIDTYKDLKEGDPRTAAVMQTAESAITEKKGTISLAAWIKSGGLPATSVVTKVINEKGYAKYKLNI